MLSPTAFNKNHISIHNMDAPFMSIVIKVYKVVRQSCLSHFHTKSPVEKVKTHKTVLQPRMVTAWPLWFGLIRSEHSFNKIFELYLSSIGGPLNVNPIAGSPPAPCSKEQQKKNMHINTRILAFNLNAFHIHVLACAKKLFTGFANHASTGYVDLYRRGFPLANHMPCTCI